MVLKWLHAFNKNLPSFVHRSNGLSLFYNDSCRSAMKKMRKNIPRGGLRGRIPPVTIFPSDNTAQVISSRILKFAAPWGRGSANSKSRGCRDGTLCFFISRFHPPVPSAASPWLSFQSGIHPAATNVNGSKFRKTRGHASGLTPKRHAKLRQFDPAYLHNSLAFPCLLFIAHIIKTLRCKHL